jgi:hypothetical protein
MWEFENLSPLRLLKKLINHGGTEDTDAHRVLLICIIDLVKLTGFGPYRQAQCITLRQK